MFRRSIPPPDTSHCFRTAPDGGIRLRPNWPELFATIAGLDGELVLQTRHTFARLIGQEPPPIWKIASGASETNLLGDCLFCESRKWTTAHAYFKHCECCGAPDRIEIRTDTDHDILQVHASNRTSLSRWSEIVTKLAAPFEPKPDLPAAPTIPFFALPDTAFRCGDSDILPALLSSCAAGKLPLSWQLCLPSIAHKREFVPTRRTYANGVLTAGDGLCACQVMLPAVTGLALQERDELYGLHIVGPDHTVLLSIAAAPSHSSVEKWHQLLHLHFPDAPLPI